MTASPGRELDAAIEVHVFGRVPCDDYEDYEIRFNLIGWQRHCAHREDTCFPSMAPRPYSTDIAAAMAVFEAVTEMTGHGEIIADMEDARGEGFIVTVSFGFDEHAGTVTGPLPTATCRAALAALGDGQ